MTKNPNSTTSWSLLALSFALVFSACEQADTEQGAPAQDVYFSPAMDYGTPGDTPLSRDDIVDAVLSASVQFQEIAREETDWRRADRRVSSLLESTSGTMFLWEQAAAGMMLDRYLVDAARNADTDSATLRYTEMLVENGSPKAGLVERALDRLDGSLPEDQRASLAVRASQNAISYYSAQEACDGCSAADKAAELFPSEALLDPSKTSNDTDAAKRLAAFGQGVTR